LKWSPGFLKAGRSNQPLSYASFGKHTVAALEMVKQVAQFKRALSRRCASCNCSGERRRVYPMHEEFTAQIKSEYKKYGALIRPRYRDSMKAVSMATIAFMNA